MAETISLDSLRDLISIGTINDVILIGTNEGFALKVHAGMSERALVTKRGNLRFFKDLNRARRFIRNDLGVGRFTVDTTNVP